jgi:hypothetical protein
MVKINGQLGPAFFHQRGLRQGDPLSPLLFNLVADTLQTLLTRKHQTFFRMPSLHILALQYADDTLIITEAHPLNLQRITRVLGRYAKMTELVTNPTKSAFTTIHVPQNLILTVEALLGCKAKSLPFRYLGLPLTIRKPTKECYLPLLALIQQKLASWKGSMLSKGGRLILVNAVLNALPIYYIQAFILPA